MRRVIIFVQLLILIHLINNFSLQAEIVFDNLKSYLFSFYAPSPYNAEFGDQVFLDGTGRNISKFQIDYYGEFDPQGTEFAQIRFYINDGDSVYPGIPNTEKPGTMIYDSGLLPICPGYNTLTLADLNVHVTNYFTWTIQFYGLTGRVGRRAGVLLYDPPSIGRSYSDFWQKYTSGWQLLIFNELTPANFATRIEAAPDTPVQIVSVVCSNENNYIKISAPPGTVCRISASDDFLNWTPVALCLLSNNTAIVSDHNLSNIKFYRIEKIVEPYMRLKNLTIFKNKKNRLEIEGSPNTPFAIEATSDISVPQWTVITNLVLNTINVSIIVSPSESTTRFYRTVAIDSVMQSSGLLWSSNLFPIITSTGPPGKRCVIEASHDLLNWRSIATNTFSFTSYSMQQPDFSNSDASSIYYRVRILD